MGKLTFVGRPKDPKVYRSLLEKGYTVVEVKKDDSIMGYIAVFDPIREDSFEVVSVLMT